MSAKKKTPAEAETVAVKLITGLTVDRQALVAGTENVTLDKTLADALIDRGQAVTMAEEAARRAAKAKQAVDAAPAPDPKE